MELFYQISGTVNSFVWGVPTLVLLIGTGIFITLRLGFIQFVKFPYIMKNTLGRLFEKRTSQDGALTPIQALTTALAGTVGTGNIAGVAGAISLGGPGAIFWMWIAALFGMCTKYAEIILAVHYREVNDKGDFVGGPMYYIVNGLGSQWRWLGVIFSIFGCVAALGTGNMTQINTIATSIGSVFSSFNPEISGSDMQRIYLIIGIIGAMLTILVLFGGMQRIGNVTEKLVPIMALVYIITSIVVIITHVNALGGVFSQIFKGAFSPSAISGGLMGVTIKQAARAGFGRGIFSNEAGLGTAPIAHAAADVDHPVHQAMYGIFEVFMDTIVICTLTAVAILISGCADGFYGHSAGTDLTIMAFSTTFGSRVASIIIASCITLFAFSTLLSWSLYGVRCMEFIFGTKAIIVYQAIYVMFVVVGATVQLSLVWEIADTANGLMAVPNLIAVLVLSPKVVKLTKEHFKGVKSA
ncbi:alanine/glycine:cation symporter family protein [Oribacterium sp. WCC10]|uniref:alanine/glycine:cation symporter family protein n=1 Tax=Oribacterium sp. WCC10 TaxID=1855343 RepID=UPI0008E26048|nr:sodium:alanine symporter family protein [Oribacterium sp. WCC10]SFG44406.1 alanine or glycine:cation symporter, AGCS family [Oribacterium sp. WCC10]